MKRGGWFILFQLLFVVAALADFLVTDYAVSWVTRTIVQGEESFAGGVRSWGFISRGFELHPRYNLFYALAWWSFINLVFCWVQPSLMWQAPRVAALLLAFWPAVRNLWLIFN